MSKKNIILFFVIPPLMVLVTIGYFVYSGNMYRTNLHESSIKPLYALKNDLELKGINHYSIWLAGEKFFCPSLEHASGKCREKMVKYLDTMEDIPEDIEFYYCLGHTIRRRTEKLFDVNIVDDTSILASGVHFRFYFDNWLSYTQNFNSGTWEPCYPWDNLEDYWKRYGKASPESIQAVIDVGKNREK